MQTKRRVIFILLLMLSLPAVAQWDTIYEGYPYHYPKYIIPDAHWFGDTLCSADYMNIPVCNWLTPGGYVDFEAGYISDTTLHVIGLAASFSMLGPSMVDYGTYSDSDYIWYHCAIHLSQPAGDSVQRMVSVHFNEPSARDASKILTWAPKPPYGPEWAAIYVYEGFLPQEYTINVGDTFYLTANGCMFPEGDVHPVYTCMTERHHYNASNPTLYPYYHWEPRHCRTRLHRELPWVSGEMYSVPHVWLIIRRDEDTCPPPQLYYERLTENTAFVRWDNNATHAASEFSFGPAGIAPEDGTLVQSAIPQHVFSGLEPGVHYTVYARARCDFARSEWTAWSAPLDICLSPEGIAVAEGPELRLAPNPAKGRVAVECGAAMEELTLTDAAGRTVLRRHAAGAASLVLDIGGLPAGIYTLHAVTAAGPATARLAVE